MHAIDLISNYRIYMKHFNRSEYPRFFRQYQKAASPFFEALLLRDIPSGVGELLDEMEHYWSGYRWKIRREAVREDDKLLLLLFLIPSAMEYGTDEAREFAEELVRQWKERFPDSEFHIGNYAELQKGFRWKLWNDDEGQL